MSLTGHLVQMEEDSLPGVEAQHPGLQAGQLPHLGSHLVNDYNADFSLVSNQ